MSQLEIDTRIIDNLDCKSPGRSSEDGQHFAPETVPLETNMNMENNATYTGIVLAGVHTAVYNNVKGKGFLRPNDDSGDKLNMMSVLMNANAYIFDIDACKVSLYIHIQ